MFSSTFFLVVLIPVHTTIKRLGRHPILQAMRMVNQEVCLRVVNICVIVRHIDSLNALLTDTVFAFHALDVCPIFAANNANVGEFRQWIMLGHLFACDDTFGKVKVYVLFQVNFILSVGIFRRYFFLAPLLLKVEVLVLFPTRYEQECFSSHF